MQAEIEMQRVKVDGWNRSRDGWIEEFVGEEPVVGGCKMLAAD